MGRERGAYSEPRATGDLDIWVEPSPENAARTYEALRAFGAPLHELTVDDLATAEVVFQIGLPPRRVDILTSITGLEFADAWPGRVQIRYGDVEVSVIGRDALISNKLALGRPKHLLDVELLRRR